MADDGSLAAPVLGERSSFPIAPADVDRLLARLSAEEALDLLVFVRQFEARVAEVERQRGQARGSEG